MPEGWIHDMLVAGASLSLGIFAPMIRAKAVRARRFDELEKRIMERAEARLAELEVKVTECETERGEMQAIKLCLRLAVPELIRKDPRNVVLKTMGDALERSFGPVNADIGQLQSLLKQLGTEPGSDPEAIRQRQRDIRAGTRSPTE